MHKSRAVSVLANPPARSMDTCRYPALNCKKCLRPTAVGRATWGERPMQDNTTRYLLVSTTRGLRLQHSTRLRKVLMLLVAGAMTGCYTLNDGKFAANVAEMKLEAMSLSGAIARLEQDGFSCDSRSARPIVTCTKTRQGIHLYSCIERVNLPPSSVPEMVGRVEIPRIMCAGL
jgi:hypothetical protein